MNLQEYQKISQRTFPELNINSELHLNLGIITECAEILDLYKKKIAYKKEIDLLKLILEFGDICFYITNLDSINNRQSKILNKVVNVKTENQIIYLIGNIINDVTLNWELNYELTTSDYFSIIEACLQYYKQSLEKTLEINVRKLQIRYPINFTNQDFKSEKNEYNIIKNEFNFN